MKSQIGFLRAALSDIERICGVSTSRDFKTVSERFRSEGWPFLGITLPSFGKDFERSLDRGYIGPDAFVHWTKRGQTPVFLGSILDQIFDRKSGDLLQHADLNAVQAVRQFTLMFGKVAMPCSEERVQRAFDAYAAIEYDAQLDAESFMFRDVNLLDYERMSSLLFRELFSEIDRKVYNGEIIPKHGPGKTADRVFGNAKYDHRQWTSRLEEYFPYREMLFPSYIHSLDVEVAHHDPEDETPVKVVAVPKTLKTPRIIAMEPTHMQYVQQGLMREFVKGIENSFLGHFIGFTDQTPNQRMAQEGSMPSELTGVSGLATLDLSEASDRVMNWHVEGLLHAWPHLSGAVQACRSTKASVPEHGVIPLLKFASMGSALTFPMEAMVFLTIICLAIESELGRPLTRSDLRKRTLPLRPAPEKGNRGLRGVVRVYGDDLIVPAEYAESVIRFLEAYGLKVNRDKSFWTGEFRESCGKEYFRGYDVSIVRQRSVLPESRRQAAEIVSTVALLNLLKDTGYEDTRQYLIDLLEELIPLPKVGSDSPALGIVVDDHLVDVHRFSEKLHRPEVWAATVRAPLPESPLDGYGALMKFFLKPEGLLAFERNHLQLAGRSRSVYIKTGWTPSR